MQIAIDGPAASGKSTAARLLAGRLGFIYIDTGAMYRAVTLAGIEKGLDFKDEQAVIDIADNIRIDIEQNPSTQRGYNVIVNGRDETDALFTPSVDRFVSVTAQIAHVRKRLVEMQREMARKANVVMAGRDICSNVLPNADLKIYLTASARARAERRQKERQEKGEDPGYQDALENVRLRDRIDSGRKDNPLVKTPDAVEVDCTNLGIEQMVDEIEKLARERFPKK